MLVYDVRSDLFSPRDEYVSSPTELLSLVPTCPKNHKNQGFLRFPDTGILTTIAILRTTRFTLIVKVWDVWDSTFKVEMILILPITS